MSGAPVPPFAFTIRLISFQLLIAMPNYYYIPPEQKQLICRLSLSLKTSEIAFHTGISIRTIQRVIRALANNRKCDGEASAHGATAGFGLLSYLCEGLSATLVLVLLMHSQYVEGLIEQRPDIYLSEIQDHLFKAFDISISLPTIHRSLKRRGYTRKKVCLHAFRNFDMLSSFRFHARQSNEMRSAATSTRLL